jgi:formylglycine-generating enzyme required for sulfatase activity
MAGNAWQWIADWYAQDITAMPTRNPTGPSSGQFKVLRGGAWSIDQSYARTTSRWYAPADFRERSVGMRCAQSQ